MNGLDTQELDLLNSFEHDEWQSVPDCEQELKRHQLYAKATATRDQRLQIRLSSSDMSTLQKHALREGLSYRTLASSIIHKYLSGILIDKRSA